MHFHTSHLKTEPFYQKWPLQGTLGTLAGVLRTLFWTLLPSEGEIVEAIEFSDLVLVHFHTPNLNLGQREPKFWPSNLCCSAIANMGQSIFTQLAFKGLRCDRSWIQGRLQNRGAFPRKICKIQPKILLLARFLGKKMKRVGSGKRSSEAGKWGSVERS